MPQDVGGADVVSRDALVRANPTRRFFVTGARPAHAPGPRYAPLVDGVVAEMIPMGTPVDVKRHFREETALQSLPGYAAVTADARRSNGFATEVREHDAVGFCSTAVDADRVCDTKAARTWYERAAAYGASAFLRPNPRRMAPGEAQRRPAERPARASRLGCESAAGKSPAAANARARTPRIPRRLRRRPRQVEANPTKSGWSGGVRRSTSQARSSASTWARRWTRRSRLLPRSSNSPASRSSSAKFARWTSIARSSTASPATVDKPN